MLATLYSARDERVIERVSSTQRLLEEEWSGEVSVISIIGATV